MDWLVLETALSLVLVAVLFVVWGIYGQKRTTLAKQAYFEALNYLRINPTDPTARMKCLAAGRIYVASLEPGGYVSAAAEARIRDDIEAMVGHLKVRS